MDYKEILKTLKEFLSKKNLDAGNSKKVEIAKWNYSMITGKNQGKTLDNIRPKDTDKQKARRRRVTVSRTPTVSHKVMRVYDGVEQANNYFEEIKIPEKNNEDTVSDFMKSLSKINNVGLKQFVFKKFKTQTFFDPNSYLILMEKDGLDYIDVIPSKNILKESFYQGNLKCIIFKTSDIDIWIYSKAAFIHARKLEKGSLGKNVFLVEKESYQIISENKGLDLPYCPAICVGFMPYEDEKNIFGSPLNIAENQFKDLIIDKSNYDVSKAAHGFLKKYAYVPKCNHKVKRNGGMASCSNGYMDDDGSKCQACNGSGASVHFSEQDVVLFKISKLDEMQNISSLTHYEKVPTDIIQSQRKDFLKWEEDILEMIFNADKVDKSKVTVTATEKLLDQKGIQAKYIEYSNKISEVIKFFAVLLADVYRIKGMEYVFGFSNDFNLESLDDLFALREKLIESNSSSVMIDIVNSKIALKLSQGDASFAKKVEAVERFRPFRYMSSNDKSMLFANIDLNSKDYIFHLHFGDIMKKVQAICEKQNYDIDFHMLNKEYVSGIIDLVLKDYMEDERVNK